MRIVVVRIKAQCSLLIECFGSADHDSFISGVTKSRLEFFTDGVVAISATLIVLDVQPGENCGDLDLEMCIVHWSEGCRVRLPDFKCYFDYAESKSKTTYMIFAYIACFMIVNLLWAQHHYLVSNFSSY